MHVQVPRNNALKSATLAFCRDESGQDLIEYALLAALIASGSVASNLNLALSISNSLGGVQSALTNSIQSPTPSISGGTGVTGTGGGRHHDGDGGDHHH